MSSPIRKCAVITGIYGQDGSLLAEYLLFLGYRVVGLVSKVRSEFRSLDRAEIIVTDIADPEAMNEVFLAIQPDECYHLAAAHHSSEQRTPPNFCIQMLRVNFLSTQAILDAILAKAPGCRFLGAGSSQMYTPEADVTIVDENTAYCPSSYYGITKVASAQLVNLLRRERRLWGVTVILFNHESTRRRVEFLSRKITLEAARIRWNANKTASFPEVKLELRDISARVDWSAATDFVRAMHMSLQVDEPRDYVLASGKVHSVSDLLDEAFQFLNLNWSEHVVAQKTPSTAPRPCLQGNPQRARDILCWEPQKSFSTLIQEMVKHDLQSIARYTLA